VVALARTHLVRNGVTFVLFAIGYAWRAGDHVELDQTRWGRLGLSAVAAAFTGHTSPLGQDPMQ
jgi:hypothetical protein